MQKKMNSSKTENSIEIILEVKKIIKVFTGTVALNGIDFEIKKGEVHAVVGENGAGKSTLMKILSGAYTKTSGEIFIDGKEVDINNVFNSNQMGISMIYQELENIPKITVAENIFIGRLPKTRIPGFVNFKKLYKNTKKLLDEFSLSIDPKQKLNKLSVAQQQFVEIIKAITVKNARVIIMDEPTSSLTKDETEKLFQIINDLKKKSISIIYISHRLDEVTGIADRISIFRDGKNVGTLKREEFDSQAIISLMIGHSLQEKQAKSIKRGKILFEVRNLKIRNRIEDFSFKLYEGEILGIAGLMGSGKDELVKSLFGLWPSQLKETYFENKKVSIKSPRDALNLGIVYLPEERKIQSLFLTLSVKENISPIWLNNIYKKFFISDSQEFKLSQESVKKLSIKTPSIQQMIINLSGGNQQKVIFSRLIAVKPKLMVLNDPTRGVDIGSKQEIYNLIRELATSGTSIILLSSEIPEICEIANRVIVLSRGIICGEFDDKQITTKNILTCATRV
jgi:ribose transport system ATP-binding protein